jgi:hypothetical protein
MRFRAAVRTSSDPITAAGEFESATIDSESTSGSTVDINSEGTGAQPTQKKWVNIALASILTLSPINIPIDIYGRRYGSASATVSEWLDLEDDWENGFLAPGGLIIPNPERKILFRKMLKLTGLGKKTPYLKFTSA